MDNVALFGVDDDSLSLESVQAGMDNVHLNHFSADDNVYLNVYEDIKQW